MKINFPNIKQADVDYAIECLNICKQDHARDCGFNHPYFTPGGSYGKQWWQLDSALALSGYKWIDRSFAETALLNFIESQKPDGRICLWGNDILPAKFESGDVLEQNEGISSLPKLFDVAYHILRGTTDEKLKIKTYEMLRKYLDWWFADRQDANTGLITAVFEETFIPYFGCAGEYAPVDTNVEVYVGCCYVEMLSRELGKDFSDVSVRKEKLKDSINQYLWNEEKGAYYPYFVKEGKLGDYLMASTFYPLRMQIAPKERQKRLIELLQDHEHFNWNTIPLTSVSKKDKIFTTTVGDYKGNASWSGNVWTLINETVVRGLCDCGENELAAELALKTLCDFSSNCAEFINPFDGKGHGVLQYAWSASQYLELLIEIIFGIDYDAKQKTLTVCPRLAKGLLNERLEISDLQIAENLFADIVTENKKVSCSLSDGSVNVSVNA